MPGRYPRGRRTSLARRPRRQVEIARSNVNGVLSSTVVSNDITLPYITDLGLLSYPPGSTIAGIKYRLSIGSATAAVADFVTTWGFIVAAASAEADDINPLTQQHLDWMEWGAWNGAILTAGGYVDLVGNGDDGFRTVRSKRKVAAVEETLWFAIVGSSSPAGLNYFISTSTPILLA